jgi:glycerophosphoryl diester phosphodiesterase
VLPDDLFGPGSPLRVIGHRGAAAFAPENTLPSFEHAVRVGADAVELDLHRSADGRLMVIHDPSLGRLTEGTGPVEALAEELARRAGYRFAEAGRPPARPLIVSVEVDAKPLIAVLRDAGLRAGAAATLTVDAARRTVLLDWSGPPAPTPERDR